MSSTDNAILGEAHSNGSNPEVNGRTPVLFVCSPRPRVGKTLIARLLTEFFVFDGRSVVAFDASPNDASLSHYLPECTERASIGDVKSQMALFDRLLINDAKPKVIDVAAELFDSFFALMANIGFLEEAPKQSISPVVLFVADRQQASSEAYELLWRRFPDSLVVPVHNQAVMDVWQYGNFPTWRANSLLLRIPFLAWKLRGATNKKGFSFIKVLETPANFPTELNEWINRSFIALRELQVCILMENFRPLFNRMRTQRDVHSGTQEVNELGKGAGRGFSV
jgi:hypothetical protein